MFKLQRNLRRSFIIVHAPYRRTCGCGSEASPSRRRGTKIEPTYMPSFYIGRSHYTRAINAAAADPPPAARRRRVGSYHNSAKTPFSAQSLSKVLSKQERNGSVPLNEALKKKQAKIHRKIISYGQSVLNWKRLLHLHREEKHQFNSTLYAAALSQLAPRMSSAKKDLSSDPLFVTFMDDLATKIEEGGLEWMRIRKAANVVRAIAQMQLNQSSSAKRIVELIAVDHATEFVTNATPQDIVDVSWSLGKLGYGTADDDMVACAFLDEVENRVDECILQTGSDIWWIAPNGGTRRPQALLSNNDTAASPSWACKSLNVQSLAQLKSIETFSKRLVADGSTHSISNAAKTRANLGISSPKIFTSIEKQAASFVSQGRPHEVANVAWACGALGYSKARNFFAAMEDRSDWIVTEGNSRDVAHVAWACAALGTPSPNLFAAMENHADRLVREGGAQDLASMAWACGTLGIDSPKLFAAISSKVKSLVEEGKMQEAADIAWACANLGVTSRNMFTFLLDVSSEEQVAQKNRSKSIAYIAWACGKLNLQSPVLFNTIEQQAARFVREGSSEDVAQMVWSCATLKMNAQDRFSAIEKEAKLFVQKATPKDVSKTLWAFGNNRYHAPTILEEVDARGSWLVERGDLTDIASAAMAFARLGYEPKTFLEALADNVEILDQKGDDAQAICNASYALCILDHFHSGVLRRLWDKAMCLDPNKFTSDVLQMLVLVHTFSEAAGVKLSLPSQELLALMQAASYGSGTTTSKFQRAVSKKLLKLGFVHEMEVSPFRDDSPFAGSNMLAIDIASTELSMALEFDGPRHFLREVGTNKVTRMENGMTKAKRRFLRRMGWTVVNIHYLDWIKARNKGLGASFLQKELCYHLDQS